MRPAATISAPTRPIAIIRRRVDKRQEALGKQLDAGIKAGTITEKEAKSIRAEFERAGSGE